MNLKAILLAGFAVAGFVPGPAHAGNDLAAAQLPDRDSSSSAMGLDELPEEEVESIVVQAGRARGSILGDIQPEFELSPADIQSHGVSTLTELLDELAPQTTGADGGAPVVLLAGRRISSFSELRNIPNEAIARVEILPEQAALRYGYRAGQKVVNMILRERFRSWTAELEGSTPTEGGRIGMEAEASFFRITNNGRLNIAVEYEKATALYEDERDLIERPSRNPYAVTGNVTGLRGAEIDPALSAIVGSPVFLAGVPGSAIAGSPSLADFAPLAGTANVTDTRPYRTLLPKSETLDINTVYNRTVLGDVGLTLNGRVTTSSSQSAQGLATAAFNVPAASPWSPFARDVTLYRYLGEFRPLERDSSNTDTHLGLTLGGDKWGWRWSLTGNYDRSLSRQEAITGALLDAARSGIAAYEINPFAPLDPSLIEAATADRSRSVTDSGDVQFSASGTLATLPAGKLALSATIGGSTVALDSWSLRNGVRTDTDLSRNALSGQSTIDIPLTSRRGDVLPFVGDLSLNLNLAHEELSDFGGLRKIGYGANWSPIRPLSLIFSMAHEESAPGMQQLGGAETVTLGARIFDYVNGETVDVTRISGGNPNLLSNDNRVMRISATLRPLVESNLSITANYMKSRDDRPIASFPSVTAAIKSAFPDRFQRDANGTLVGIDTRPVNFLQRDRQNLKWGFNLSTRLGEEPPRPARRTGEPGTDGASRGEGQRGPRSGPGGPQARGTRLSLSAYHSWFIEDRVMLAPGLPELDLLRGDTIGTGGGQPRHRVELRGGLTRNGMGLRVSANWQDSTTVEGGAQPLDFSDLTTVNLRLFANLGSQRSLVEKMPFLRGSRVRISVNNLFNQRMRVTTADGTTPVGYQPAYMDALGRTVEISFRKLFFTPPPRPSGG